MNLQNAVINKFSIPPEKIAVAGDGGTIGFELVDSEGEIHQLFIDRRIGTKTRDHLYGIHYPADSKSIYLGLNESILTELYKTMN
jgi:hypothetical protein